MASHFRTSEHILSIAKRWNFDTYEADLNIGVLRVLYELYAFQHAAAGGYLKIWNEHDMQG